MIIKKIIINFLILFFSTIIGVFLVEVCLQFLRPDLPYQYMPQKIVRSFFKESIMYDFTLEPNYEGKFMMSAASFDSIVSTNSLGWRDKEPDEREKVFVFGDSFVFGFGLNNGDTIPAELEKLDADKRDFVNLGYTAGRSPDSYLNYMRQNKSIRNQPVILLVYSNDLNDISNNSYFNEDGISVQVDDQSVYEVRGNLSYIRAGSLFQHKSFTTSKLPLRMIYWLKQSYIIALLRFSFDKAFTKNSQEVTAQNVAAKTKKFSQRYNKEIDIFTRSIQGIANYSSNLTVFTIGNRQEISIPEFYKEVAKICSILKLDYFHIPSFDSTHYWEKDAHYNKKGAKKAASFIYKSVLQD